MKQMHEQKFSRLELLVTLLSSAQHLDVVHQVSRFVLCGSIAPRDDFSISENIEEAQAEILRQFPILGEAVAVIKKRRLSYEIDDLSFACENLFIPPILSLKSKIRK